MSLPGLSAKRCSRVKVQAVPHRSAGRGDRRAVPAGAALAGGAEQAAGAVAQQAAHWSAAGDLHVERVDCRIGPRPARRRRRRELLDCAPTGRAGAHSGAIDLMVRLDQRRAAEAVLCIGLRNQGPQADMARSAGERHLVEHAAELAALRGTARKPDKLRIVAGQQRALRDAGATLPPIPLQAPSDYRYGR